MQSKTDQTPKIAPLGLELNSQGETVGCDPRKMTPDELNSLGHERAPLSKVIREKCLDCAHTESEVRKCTALKCVLWPYRMRKNPFSERVVSESAMKALADYRAKSRAEDVEDVE